MYMFLGDNYQNCFFIYNIIIDGRKFQWEFELLPPNRNGIACFILVQSFHYLVYVGICFWYIVLGQDIRLDSDSA